MITNKDKPGVKTVDRGRQALADIAREKARLEATCSHCGHDDDDCVCLGVDNGEAEDWMW